MSKKYIYFAKAVHEAYKKNITQLTFYSSRSILQIAALYRSEGFINDFKVFYSPTIKKNKIVWAKKVTVYLVCRKESLTLFAPVNLHRTSVYAQAQTVSTDLTSLTVPKLQRPYHNLKIISKPSRPIYISAKDLRKIISFNSIIILQTDRGLVNDTFAKNNYLGGFILFKFAI